MLTTVFVAMISTTDPDGNGRIDTRNMIGGEGGADPDEIYNT